MQKKDNHNLLEPATAVEDYFDMLLQDVQDDQGPGRPLPVKGDVLVMPELQSDLAKIGNDEFDPPSPTDTEAAAPQSQPQLVEDTTATQKPDYQLPIQCLMFMVGEQQLSMPLIDMGSVVPWSDDLTSLPHSPDWFLGLLKYRDINVRVVDTAQMMQIDSVQADQQPAHILVFADESWAITCDQLGQVVELDEDDIKWARPEAENLVLGTIKQSLAILLDPHKILGKLKQQDSSQDPDQAMR